MSSQTSPDKTALFNPFSGHLEQLFGYIDNLRGRVNTASCAETTFLSMDHGICS
jgi:hypothetical protein